MKSNLERGSTGKTLIPPKATSMTGCQTVWAGNIAEAATNSETGFPRRQSTIVSPEHPSRSPNSSTRATLSSSSPCRKKGLASVPLCRIARWKSPSVSIVIRALGAKMVKSMMLVCT